MIFRETYVVGPISKETEKEIKACLIKRLCNSIVRDSDKLDIKKLSNKSDPNLVDYIVECSFYDIDLK